MYISSSLFSRKRGLIPPKRSDGSISALRPVEDLILTAGTEGIYALLVRPEFVSSVTALRRLSVSPQKGDARTLIHAASRTLEHINFSMHNGAFKDLTFLPPLPALRIFEVVLILSLPLEPRTNILDIISAILTSNASPHLVEIVLTYWHFLTWGFPPVLDERTMAELDSALAEHSAAPTLRWRLDVTHDDAARHFATFTAIVRRWMPRARDQGQLAFDEYRDSDRYADGWPPWRL
ncbi:hypothetical protein B0H11DRAFT_563612 [Mycena galericulata]|nr:hypothetical protein B0H11DRAFT_563612 [Mycena galericulata]